MRTRLYIVLGLFISSLFLIVAPAFTANKIIDVQYSQLTPAAKKQVDCLAENIYYEAGSESFEGKLAVAQVTLNRVASGQFANSICAVVHQKTGETYQFSWVGMEKYGKDTYRWEESKIVAKKAMTEPVAHALLSKQNALYYHAKYVNPGWKLTKVGQIGNHIFYKENRNGRI